VLLEHRGAGRMPGAIRRPAVISLRALDRLDQDQNPGAPAANQDARFLRFEELIVCFSCFYDLDFFTFSLYVEHDSTRSSKYLSACELDHIRFC
jgi:hypothetical protein